jgi:restriction system protein
MNLSVLADGYWSPLWWILPTIVALLILKSARFKGATGEALVRFSARLKLHPETYRALHNVSLKGGSGTTQIDHIIVSRFGVFVIETKHMKGWIFGSERDSQWTQSIFGNSYSFQNPLRQNYRHVKVLEAALDIPAAAIHSLVVFSGASTFMSRQPANVFHGQEYIGHIKSFQAPILSEAKVRDILEKLQATRLPPTLATRRLHIQNVRSLKTSYAEKPCPRCGSPMILRTARSGWNAGKQFWGCSTYPRCRAIENLAG